METDIIFISISKNYPTHIHCVLFKYVVFYYVQYQNIKDKPSNKIALNSKYC